MELTAIAKVRVFSLGLGDIKQIAAAHGRGVSQLLQDALKPLESDFDMIVDGSLKKKDVSSVNASRVAINAS